MSGSQLIVGTFLMGVSHAFEVDHISTVSAFVARRPHGMEAMKHGFKWASGHGASLLILGSALYLFKLSVSPTLQNLMEGTVGLGMLMIGFYLLKEALSKAVPSLIRLQDSGPIPFHAHSHSHRHGDHAHHHHHHFHEEAHSGHPSFWMGTLHGIAGTGALIVPLLVGAGSENYSVVLMNVVAFSVGVALAMAAYSAFLGQGISLGVSRVTRCRRWVEGALGLWVVIVGGFWIIRSGSVIWPR